jgi:hypothetical protein
MVEYIMSGAGKLKGHGKGTYEDEEKDNAPDEGC